MEFIAVDLETTGTLPYVDRIIEVAAVRFKNFKPETSFQTLVNPEIEISEEATRVNGISNEDVKGKPTIREVLNPLAEFCSSVPMVAHNASFDFQFLKSAIEKYKTKAPEGVMMDTYGLAKKVFPEIRNHRLKTLIEHFNIRYGTLHRAEQDAKCCGFLFIKLIEKLQTQNVKKLIQISGRNELKFPQFKDTYQQLMLSI